MKTYDVSVCFELPAENEQEAMDMMADILAGMEQYDQLPYWYINDAEPLLEPDVTHQARVTEGETDPLTNPN